MGSPGREPLLAVQLVVKQGMPCVRGYGDLSCRRTACCRAHRQVIKKWWKGDYELGRASSAVLSCKEGRLFSLLCLLCSLGNWADVSSFTVKGEEGGEGKLHKTLHWLASQTMAG